MFTRVCAGVANGTIAVAVGLLLAPVACAQSGDTEVGEVALLGGGTFGLGTHPAVKGSAGVAVSRYGILLIQTSFSPLGNETIRWPARSTVAQSYLYDFGLDFHIRIPVKERWAPYGILGAGFLWDVTHLYTGSSGVGPTIRWDQVNGAFHTGGGLRYYVRKNWGIRSELGVIVSTRTYTQFQTGIFYVTPPDWP